MKIACSESRGVMAQCRAGQMIVVITAIHHYIINLKIIYKFLQKLSEV